MCELDRDFIKNHEKNLKRIIEDYFSKCDKEIQEIADKAKVKRDELHKEFITE